MNAATRLLTRGTSPFIFLLQVFLTTFEREGMLRCLDALDIGSRALPPSAFSSRAHFVSMVTLVRSGVQLAAARLEVSDWFVKFDAKAFDIMW